jgi:cytidylate kinase
VRGLAPAGCLGRTSRDRAMQVICISKGIFGGGKDLAERVARDLGCGYLSREELIEAAVSDGIQVGKLEMAMIKPRAFSERLAAEKEHYLAFCTAHLCKHALEGSVVYHGRTGHLLLPGVRHVLRVRVVSDEENRVRAVMDEMRIERKKASRYIQAVDDDRRRWAQSMYGVSLDEMINYDIIVNVEQMGVGNAASVLVGTAQLPNFQLTPSSITAMQDLRLGAEARLALARDERTARATFKVRADAGVVTVTYLPHDAGLAEFIPDILRPVAGIHEARITMAVTNILWIQHAYQPHTETYDRVVEIATKWNAAVELVRLAPEQAGASAPVGVAPESASETAMASMHEYNGGIEDDSAEDAGDDGGLKVTLDELARIGRSGGGRAVYGGQHQLIDSLDRNVRYTLTVVGDVFPSKEHAAKLRATRDLGSVLGDRLKAPVVTAEELSSEYLFGKRDLTRTIVFLALCVLMYWLVFTHQEQVLAFLAHAGWYADATEGTFLARFEWMRKVVVSAVVFLSIPIVAYSYGSVTSAVLKWIKMD